MSKLIGEELYDAIFDRLYYIDKIVDSLPIDHENTVYYDAIGSGILSYITDTISRILCTMPSADRLMW